MFYDSKEAFFLIKDDINKKYDITNPIFKIRQEIIHSEESIINWISKRAIENKWVKYKKITNNIFELKDFFPDPSNEICNKKIKYHFIIYGLEPSSNFFLKIGNSLFDLQSAKKELLLILKQGAGPEIYFNEISKFEYKGVFGNMLQELAKNNLSIFSIGTQEQEIHRPIGTGFYELEQGQKNAYILAEGL